MSETRFTPGPWVVLQLATGPAVHTADPDHRVQICRPNGKAGEQDANAQLIASAPDMYAELEAFADWAESYIQQQVEMYGGRFGGPLVERAQSARLLLARARGESVEARP